MSTARVCYGGMKDGGRGTMPIYVYACAGCDIVLEERRPMELADFPPVECPVCHELCERQMAAFSINRGATEVMPDSKAGHPPGCPCCAGLRYPASGDA